jgi:hypothetical protein
LKDHPEVKILERMVAILHAKGRKEDDGNKMDKEMDEQDDGRPRKRQKTLWLCTYWDNNPNHSVDRENKEEGCVDPNGHKQHDPTIGVMG